MKSIILQNTWISPDRVNEGLFCKKECNKWAQSVKEHLNFEKLIQIIEEGGIEKKWDS